MKRDFNYSRNGVECVSVNQWVAIRRNDNGRRHPVIGKLVNGKVVPTNYIGKI